MRPIVLALAVLAAAASAPLVACDTRATASNAGDHVPVDRQSKELESCASTQQCAAGLRCFASICQRDARSTVGDYYATRGALATSVDEAIDAYTEAQAAYEAEQVAAPPDLDCAYGRALSRARGRKDLAERAARVLHRCLLAAPPGSALRGEALATLANLHAAGLDPKQLAKPALADLYLTREPARPPTENLAVTVTADPPQAGKTFPLVIERLTAADLRAAFVSCWEKHQSGGVLTARLPFTVVYRPSEFDDEPGTYKITADAPAGADAGATCIYGAAGPLLVALKGVRDKIDTTLVVTVK